MCSVIPNVTFRSCVLISITGCYYQYPIYLRTVLHRLFSAKKRRKRGVKDKNVSEIIIIIIIIIIIREFIGL